MAFVYRPSAFMLPDSHYNKDKADRAVAFIEHLCHTKGKWAGQPFLLLPWQEQIVRDLFGIVKENGKRQFLTAYIEVPKKNGKSELAAAIALYLLYADNEPSAEVYGAACDRNQASIVFDVARQMVEMSPALMRRSKIRTAGKRIINYRNAGFYQVLSAETGTKHGLNVSGLVFDEIHAQPNRKLYDVLTNVTYTGNMLFQKEYVTDPILKKRKKNRGELPRYYVENTHEPIIDKETFDYVQQEMARRKELGALANKSLNTTCFTGKIKCGICGRSYMHNRRTDRGFEEFWDCGSHKLKGRNCGAKGSIPHAVLVKESTEVLGLDDFDEQAFLDQVEKIVVPEYHVMVFCMKNGQKLIRHWVSTAKKDCWTDEYKDRQRAWMKNYMANGKGTRFSAFTTRVRCALCGSSFRRCKTKHDRPVYWRCSKGGKCESVSIREDDLKRVAAEAMGLENFDEDRFREKVESIEAGKPDCLTVHFKSGRTKEISYTPTPSKRRSKARRKESREKWQRQ